MRRNSCSRSLRAGAATCALGLLLAGCAQLTIPQEQKFGDQMARRIRGEFTLVRDDVLVDYVNDIGDRILAAAGSMAASTRVSVTPPRRNWRTRRILRESGFTGKPPSAA